MARKTTAVEKKNGSNGATLGFEVKLWQAADKLRNNMDAAEYKHVVLGLIFLKYISDAFEEHHARLVAEQSKGADPEDPDEYRAQNIFWVPKEARWSHLQANAKQPTIGKIIDDAMVAIERDNKALKGVLPKDYARPALDKQRLGELIDLIGTIGLGDKEKRSKDILGRVYEYFLSQFASAEGKKGGQFYTPRCVVQVLVFMLAPYKGRVYDPCCGSGGMFVQSEKFIEEHDGKVGDISIYGQESNPTTWRLAKMNLASAALTPISARSMPTASTATCTQTLRPTTSSPIRRSTQATGAASVCGKTSAGSSACRRRATPTLPRSSISSITLPRRVLPDLSWPTGACPRIRAARGRFGRISSRRISWTAWSRCRGNCSIPRRSRCVVVYRTGQEGRSQGPPLQGPAWRNAFYRRPQDGQDD